MSPVFNTANDGTDDSMYKNFTLGATPAWVANNLCAFICIPVDDAIKVSAEESMETRMA